MFAIAGESGHSQGLNHSGLGSFDRKQTPSPSLSNSIDLNSASSRSSSRPSIGRQLTLIPTRKAPTFGPAREGMD
jgi:hypothetical protein